jgi:hypothetical protein
MDPADVLLCEQNGPIKYRLDLIARRALMQNDFVFRANVIRAIRSICACPNPVKTIEDALRLDGVGPKLASEILKSVTKYSAQADDSSVQQVSEKSRVCANTKEAKKRIRLTNYCPEVGKVLYFFVAIASDDLLL